MGYCVASGGNFLWFSVWRVVVIFMFYCVASGGNLCVIVWPVVVICYGLLCGEWC
jgi:hypothetical protein